jgi:hypothetical protein
MKSIKPGRASSAMGALGSVIAIVFGIGWTILAYSITRGAPFPVVGTIFPLFGVLFVIIGIANLALSLRNTVAPQRNSIVDIVDAREEPDPLNAAFGQPVAGNGSPAESTETRLKKLEALRSTGAISPDEYHATRQRILNEI